MVTDCKGAELYECNVRVKEITEKQGQLRMSAFTCIESNNSTYHSLITVAGTFSGHRSIRLAARAL